MTDVHEPAPARRWSAPAITRQPVVHPDRSVFAYAVRAQIVPPREGEAAVADELELEQAVEVEYGQLDLAGLAGDRPLLLRATRGLLAGDVELPGEGVTLVLEISADQAAGPGTLTAIRRLAAAGVRCALGDYTGSPAQDALLGVAPVVKVDARADAFAARVAHAHEAGATVVVEHADHRERIQEALAAGADLLQGPMFERDTALGTADFTAGELQCLELMSLLSDDPVDQAAIIGIVAADPMLTVRVLHLVNSAAFGLPRQIDSVRQAVVLVGPHHLSALAASSLVASSPSTVSVLWSILTRALACWDLAGIDTGYTVGLLSALAEQRHIPVEALVSRTGVSAEVADALYFHAGPLGEALAAVAAHEDNDLTGVLATGLDPRDVAAAYLAAVPEALAIASSLSVDG